jgi:N-methylhydantoinase A
MSDVKHDYVQSRMTPLGALTAAEINSMFDRMLAEAADELRSDGFSVAAMRLERALDMRYAGQGYEITLACESLHDDGLAALRLKFDVQHQAMFGHSAPAEPVEVVSYRVRGIGRVPPVAMPKFARTGASLADALRETRSARFDGLDLDCPVYQRERLDVGLTVAGPAILDQLDCTTVLYPGQAARVDEWKNLIVTRAT